MHYSILLLEDDVNLSDTVEEYLTEQGYDVTAVYDGDEAADMLYEKNFDLYLLDVNVPGQNGFELLRHKRGEGGTAPAIYITSLNSVQDLEKGYESGCDDYIRKPFALKELALRIETLLKRGYFHESGEMLRLDGQLAYDLKNNQLYREDTPVNLGNKENRLLQLFLRHRDELLSHERIYDALWEYDEQASESSLRTYIKNLRKHLGKDRIVSVKKLGYRFTSK